MKPNKPLKDWEIEFDDFLTDCEAYSTFDGNNPFDLEKMKYVWEWIQVYKAKAVSQTKSQIVEGSFGKMENVKKEIIRQYDIWYKPAARVGMLANSIINFVIKPILQSEKQKAKSQIVEQILGMECMKDEKYSMNPRSQSNGIKGIRNQLRSQIKEEILKIK